MEEDADPLLSIAPRLQAFSRQATSDISLYDVSSRDVVTRWESLGMLDTRRLVFVVHGFRSSAQADWVVEMKDSMLIQMDQTVVTVDWSGGANLRLWKYEVSAANTLVVGRWLSDYTKEVKFRRPDAYIWGVGHSFGAHSLGMAGKLGGCMSRITALDPAGPGFEKLDSRDRLSPTDASFMVDVIHTDGFDGWEDNPDPYPTKYFGTIKPLGTLDFYPNYGIGRQPGASLIAGSHFRAYELFNWSILNPGKLKTNLLLDGTPSLTTQVRTTRRTLRTAEMGYYADANPPEERNLLYYLETNGGVPYAPVFK